MNLISSKKMLRIEKKKKKMEAFQYVLQLNNKDNLKRASSSEPIAKKPCTESDNCSNKSELSATQNQNSEGVVELANCGKPKLFGEEFLDLKKMLREKQQQIKQQPKFRLREVGEAASLRMEQQERIPLFLCDIQHLVMYSQLGHHSPYTPTRWCHLEKFNKLKRTNVLIIENVSLYHYISYESTFKFLNSKFLTKLEMITPGAYKGDIVQDLATVPLTMAKMKKFISEYGTLEDAVTNSPELYDRIKDLFPLSKEEYISPEHDSLPKGDKFPRTHLLLSGWQMVEENFPLPIKGLMNNKYAGYVLTKDTYKDVTSTSPMFGIDCEMCRTTSQDLELTRISIVDENYDTFYEELVKPDNRIIDYLTRFSGITAKMMLKVTKKLKDVQEDLQRLLPPDAILVGQSLSNDLHALKMMHPYVIDTSVIYNITGDRNRKSKLQILSREFLNERIQESRGGHCSIEDSSASLKLTKLKLSKHIHFGDAVMESVASQVKHHPELGHPFFATSMLKQTTKVDKTAYVVGHEDISHKYKYFTFKDHPDTEQKSIKFGVTTKKHKITSKMCKKINESSLNIAHVGIEDYELEKDTPQVCRDIDHWIESIYNATDEPSLCIVVFGGQKQFGNGCCFITLKSAENV